MARDAPRRDQRPQPASISKPPSGRGDVQTQCEAAWWELSHGPGYGLAAIKAAKDAKTAAIMATELFEKAGVRGDALRRDGGQMVGLFLQGA